jgi:hypothetical protein
MPVVKITKHLASVTNVPLGLEDFGDDDDTLSEVSSSRAESRPIGVLGDLIIPALNTNRGSHSLKEISDLLLKVKDGFPRISQVGDINNAHYEWKVAEKWFKMAFMMNKLATINFCGIILEK